VDLIAFPPSCRRGMIGGMDERRGVWFWIMALAATVAASSVSYGVSHLLPWPHPSELTDPILGRYARAVFVTVTLLGFSGLALVAGMVRLAVMMVNRHDDPRSVKHPAMLPDPPANSN